MFKVMSHRHQHILIIQFSSDKPYVQLCILFTLFLFFLLTVENVYFYYCYVKYSMVRVNLIGLFINAKFSCCT